MTLLFLLLLLAITDNWAQSDDVAMDNPLGGIKRGWSQIRSDAGSFLSPLSLCLQGKDYLGPAHSAGLVFPDRVIDRTLGHPEADRLQCSSAHTLA